MRLFSTLNSVRQLINTANKSACFLFLVFMINFKLHQIDLEENESGLNTILNQLNFCKRQNIKEKKMEANYNGNKFY
jgi:hypothetical protein